MTDITIPPEAEEAAKREAAATVYRLVEPDTRAHELTDDERKELALSALRAGIAAWPGMHTEDHDTPWPPRIILPLLKEPA